MKKLGEANRGKYLLRDDWTMVEPGSKYSIESSLLIIHHILLF